MKQLFRLVHQTARDRAQEAVRNAPDGYICTIAEPTRTLDQNSALWPLLTEISKQVNWHGMMLSEDDWKDIFSATLKKQRSAPNLDGTGFVIFGQRTSQMTKKEFSDLLTLATAFAAEHGVKCELLSHQNV